MTKRSTNIEDLSLQDQVTYATAIHLRSGKEILVLEPYEEVLDRIRAQTQAGIDTDMEVIEVTAWRNRGNGKDPEVEPITIGIEYIEAVGA